MSEVIALEVESARRLTERIRLIAQNVADNVTKLRELVQEAKDSEVHRALGFSSWTAYIQDVFGDEPLRLARDVRRELVAELSAQGMSTRAIAPILGVDHKTVHNDIVRTVESSTVTEVLPVDSTTGEVLPAPRTVTGLDGREITIPPKKEREPDPSKEVGLINDVRLYLRTMSRSPQIARLSEAGKQHLINALNDTIRVLEGN